MFYRKLIILAVCLIGLYWAYNASYTQYWLNTYILNPSNSMTRQLDKTSVEERKLYRYGNLYNLSKFIHRTLDTSTRKVDYNLILLPPNAYLKAHDVTSFTMPDPSEFYYLTHLRSVWTNSPDANKANWAIVVQGKNMIGFLRIVSDEQRTAILDSFNKFKPAL